jgi:hypothetical protein
MTAHDPVRTVSTPHYQASLTPEDGITSDAADPSSLGYDHLTAVYDISARVVYMPNGSRLEAHSGLGSTKDDLRHASERGVGSTTLAVYDLSRDGSRRERVPRAPEKMLLQRHS